MSNKTVTSQLAKLRDQLHDEVAPSYDHSDEYGRERFDSWKRRAAGILTRISPDLPERLTTKLRRSAFTRRRGESAKARFVREYGQAASAFIDSLVVDLERGELEPSSSSSVETGNAPGATKDGVFIVHGHNELEKTKVARFVEKLGFKAIILHEQVNRGMTVIEKIEAHTNVGFALILYTPDDFCGNAGKGESAPRARQNVVFEHGYLLAKLGRNRVAPLVTKGVELPSDISGVVYIDAQSWELEVAKELKSADYAVDFNKLM